MDIRILNRRFLESEVLESKMVVIEPVTEMSLKNREVDVGINSSIESSDLIFDI